MEQILYSLAMMQQGNWTQVQISKTNPNIKIGFLPMPMLDEFQKTWDNLKKLTHAKRQNEGQKCPSFRALRRMAAE